MNDLGTKVHWPDYQRCGVNLVSSIASYFGMPDMHPGIPEVDSLLSRGAWRSVVLLVLDGLGSVSLSQSFPGDAYLPSRRMMDLSAVFPPTTVAATTSLRSGLYPNEHDWLGWTMFFPQTSTSVDVFSNHLQFTQQPAPFPHAAKTFLPFASLEKRIQKAGLAAGFAISRYDELYADNLEQLRDQILTVVRGPGRQYVYAYTNQPDTDMHIHGVDSLQVRNTLLEIDQQMQALAMELPKDVLLLATADHGLIDAQPVVVEEHPRLSEMLLRPGVLEPRACAFYVKPRYYRAFPEAFEQAFGSDFLLLDSREALSRGLFGPGVSRQDLASYIGDYLALAISDKALFTKREHCKMLGMHAGMTAREMIVPLLVITQ
ncbi:MAG: alkaline phosphatase family protein [Christensenellales bacterium]